MSDTSTLSVHIESKGQRWEHVRVLELTGREAISEPFRFDLEVACDPDQLLPEQALPGAEVSVVFEDEGLEVRRIHGVLGPIRDRLDPAGDRRAYRLRVVPRASRLALVETQEIYLDLSIPEILRSKLEQHDIQPDELELRLMEKYAAREIVAQYRESDLAFVCRLCEHLGVSFYFEHEGGCDKLVFTDHAAGFRPLSLPEGAERLTFRPRGEAADVFALELVTDQVPSNYIVQDYNYRSPQVDLTGLFELPSGSGGGVVEYGSHVKTPEEADRLARVRAEERLAGQRVYEGKSSRPALSAGRRATLADHPRLAGPEPLLFVEVTHHGVFPGFQGEGAGRKTTYTNTFRAIPGDVAYRPPRRTPRPVIHGVVTGIIQPGSNGETGGVADLDSEGRYTVQLHFDTADRQGQKASHRVRMAQPYAGANYGMHFPLRPGTEVLVAFANGDPDRPVIVGAMFNATAPSPVAAATATKHQLKSSSGAIFEFGSRS